MVIAVHAQLLRPFYDRRLYTDTARMECSTEAIIFATYHTCSGDEVFDDRISWVLYLNALRLRYLSHYELKT